MKLLGREGLYRPDQYEYEGDFVRDLVSIVFVE